MSTANGKAKEGQTPNTAAGANASVALVQSTQTATNDGPDEFHGQGGLYQIIDGKRQLVADKPVTAEE